MSLAVGTECYYRMRDGAVVTVQILKVHHEELPPYYTITIDGTERQTVREKLRPCSEGPWPTEPRPPRITHAFSASSMAALDKLAKSSPDAHALFQAIDRDKDGAITIRELSEYFVSTDNAFAKRLFKAIDADDDGVIDIDEFRIAHKFATETREGVKAFFSAGPPEELFAIIDTDRDGAITRRELERYLRETIRSPDPTGDAERLFQVIDRDDDKLIDLQEFLLAHRRVAAELTAGSQPRSCDGGLRSQPPLMRGPSSSHAGTSNANEALGGAFGHGGYYANDKRRGR
jgi:Ca2+-binding EF-hand superfamily protein